MGGEINNGSERDDGMDFDVTIMNFYNNAANESFVSLENPPVSSKDTAEKFPVSSEGLLEKLNAEVKDNTTELGQYYEKLKELNKNNAGYKTNLRWWANETAILAIQSWNFFGSKELIKNISDNKTDIYSIKNKKEALENLLEGKTLTRKNIKALKEGSLNRLLVNFTNKNFKTPHSTLETLLGNLHYGLKIEKIKVQSNPEKFIEEKQYAISKKEQNSTVNKLTLEDEINLLITQYIENREKGPKRFYSLFPGYDKADKVNAANLLLERKQLKQEHLDILSEGALGSALAEFWLIKNIDKKNKANNYSKLEIEVNLKDRIVDYGGKAKIIRDLLTRLNYSGFEDSHEDNHIVKEGGLNCDLESKSSERELGTFEISMPK